MSFDVELEDRPVPEEGEKFSLGVFESRQEPVDLSFEDRPLLARASSTVLSPRDVRIARWVGRQGFNRPFLIVRAARREGVRASRALAMLTMETGSCRNVYGHDPVSNRAPKGAAVTRSNYVGIYLPDRRAGLGMQGVGPTQLTWFEFQNRADRLGGCWRVYPNLRVGFAIYHAYVRDGATPWEAAKRYNGAGEYADRFMAWDREWVRRLDRAGF